MMPKVAIVYLSYNTRPYLDAVADSIRTLNYPKDRLTWVIVDNDSPDKSAEMIREKILPESGRSLPVVTFFPNPTNDGFAQGNNLGINHALLDGADYVFLLNNDAKFHPDAIDEAVKMAQRDPRIGSVQSLMLLWQDEARVNSTGGMAHWLGFGFVRDSGRRREEITAQDGEEIFYGSGAATLYRADLLRQIGLLDRFLFLYHEDLQLGWRIRLAGQKNVLAKNSIVYHHYEFSRSVAKIFWMERNRPLVHATHLRILTLLLLAPFFLIDELAVLLFAAKEGWLKQKLLSYVEFFRPRTWVYIWKTRRSVALTRQVPDREVVRLFTARIEHQEKTNPILIHFANPAMAAIWWWLKRIIFW
jgi:hypothetical protein